MNIPLVDSIGKTLSYASVFHFPLTRDEIWYWLVTEKPVDKKKVNQALELLTKKGVLYKKEEYYSLQKTRTVFNRKEKALASERKIQKARFLTRLFSLLPTVSLVAVSGAVSAGNADSQDDIDIFIVCKKNTLWITRFFLVVATSILNVRRKPGMSTVCDLMCLNMFMSDEALSLKREKQTLFTAHEILQLVVLYDTNQIQQKLLLSNPWVATFYRNVWEERREQMEKVKKTKQENISFFPKTLIYLAGVLDPVFYFFQKQYLSSGHTTEIIERNLIMFHPNDASLWVMHLYEKQLKRYRAVLYSSLRLFAIGY